MLSIQPLLTIKNFVMNDTSCRLTRQTQTSKFSSQFVAAAITTAQVLARAHITIGMEPHHFS